MIRSDRPRASSPTEREGTIRTRPNGEPISVPGEVIGRFPSVGDERIMCDVSHTRSTAVRATGRQEMDEPRCDD